MKRLLAVGLYDNKQRVGSGSRATCIDFRFSAFCGSSSQVLSCSGGPLKGYPEEWILTQAGLSLHSGIHWAPALCMTHPWATVTSSLKGRHPGPPARAGGLRTDEDPRWEAVEEEAIDERNTRFLNLVIDFARVTTSSNSSTAADGPVFE